MHTWRRRAAAVAVVPFLLLTGCGDEESGDSGDDDRSAGSSSSRDSVELDGNQSDGCDYLPADDVTEAFGEEMRLLTEGPVTCLFQSVADGMATSVTLNVTELAIDQAEYAAGTRELCEAEVTEVAAGDEAFACLTPVGTQGFVYEGGYSIVLDVLAADDADGVEIAAALLPSAHVA